MKCTTLTIIFLLVAKSVASLRCESDADCSEDQCCAFKGIKAGKNCERRLLEKEICIPGAYYGNHLFICPCQSGLACLPTDYNEFPFVGRIAVTARCMTLGKGGLVSRGSFNEISYSTDMKN